MSQHMSQEAVSPGGVPHEAVSGQPEGLLERMERLMAALTADLTELGAELRGPKTGDDDRG
ncbi:hypothetical protein ACFYZE_12975 [Streptomyces sp. NPDC001796]|uniref:hypothetical protein n=1 Tax=Streptomyces sp. NPDC001796 TaxID=3364609 RepID=UPI00368A534D